VAVNDKIKNLLKIKNFSYEDVADRLGVHKNTIANICSGKSDPSLAFLQFLIMEFPSVSLNKILANQEPSKLKIFNEPETEYITYESIDEAEQLKKQLKELEEKHTRLEGEFKIIKEQLSELLKYLLLKQG
jgi:transcriptional regulator with XRE-family HTH domain